MMVAHYFTAERRCLLDSGSYQDYFQFGVPSIMASLPQLLNASGRSARWRTYWGFDSFLGLPEEAPVAQRPNAAMWRAGQFSLAHSLVSGGHVRTAASGAEEYVLPKGRAPLSAESARKQVEGRYTRGRPAHLRVRLVGGFYNESLTPQLARLALPAAYVDIDCDLYVSTVDVLRWLCEHRLLRVGSVIGYDDWFETPLLAGGESRAHHQAAHRYAIEFVHLPHVGYPRCKEMLFRVASIGVRADPGITLQMAHDACYRAPAHSERRVTRGEWRRSGGAERCLARAKEYLGGRKSEGA